MEKLLVISPFSPVYDDELPLRFQDIITKVSEHEAKDWIVVMHNDREGKVPRSVVTPFLPSPHIIGIALCDFSPESNSGQFLEFKEGDEIVVLERFFDGWSIGTCHNHYGLFPEGTLQYNQERTFRDIESIIITKSDKTYPFITALIYTIDEIANMKTVAEDLLASLVLLFDSNNQFFEYINDIISHEVHSCLDEGVLFRKNSWASKLLMRYVRIVSFDYLSDSVLPCVLKVAESEGSFELDPLRMSEEDDEATNQEALISQSLHFLEGLLSVVDNMPPGMKKCYHIVKENVKTRFPHAAEKAVGGFYFLRVIGPILAGGNLSSIRNDAPLPTLTPLGRRKLILLTKFLQTIANEVDFGFKEVFMIPLNGRIEEHKALCSKILQKMSCPIEVNSTGIESNPAELNQNLKIFHGWMCKKLMTEKLQEFVREGILSHELFQDFCETLLYCGAPLPDYILTGEKGDKLNKFIEENNEKPVNKRISRKQAKKMEKEEKKMEKEEKKKERLERKQDEKMNRKPEGVFIYGSLLKGRADTSGKTKSRYYAIYSKSMKIFVFASVEDAPHNAIGVIELGNNFVVNVEPKKNEKQWSFTVVTDKAEYLFSAAKESILRKWMVQLDGHSCVTSMSTEQKMQRQDVTNSLREKLAGHHEEILIIKQRLADSINDPSRGDADRLEELMCASELLRDMIRQQERSNT